MIRRIRFHKFVFPVYINREKKPVWATYYIVTRVLSHRVLVWTFWSCLFILVKFSEEWGLYLVCRLNLRLTSRNIELNYHRIQDIIITSSSARILNHDSVNQSSVFLFNIKIQLSHWNVFNKENLCSNVLQIDIIIYKISFYLSHRTKYLIQSE